MNQIIKRHLALLAGLLIFAWLPPALADDWEVIMDTGRLLVERRAYEGSALDELRGVTVLKASLNAVVALLRDAPYNEQWVHRSGGAKVLAEEGFARVYVYGIVAAPAPLRDRDTVVRFDYEQDPQSKSVLITITNFADYVPEKDGYIRVPDFGGFWKLEPRDGGRVEVTYQVRGKPGGWVPLWLANYGARVSVMRTLKNMTWAVERYEDAHSEFVVEVADGELAGATR